MKLAAMHGVGVGTVQRIKAALTVSVVDFVLFLAVGSPAPPPDLTPDPSDLAAASKDLSRVLHLLLRS
jgi:hypothetical protein